MKSDRGLGARGAGEGGGRASHENGNSGELHLSCYSGIGHDESRCEERWGRYSAPDSGRAVAYEIS